MEPLESPEPQLEELLHLLKGPAQYYAYRVLGDPTQADDIAQEACINVWRTCRPPWDERYLWIVARNQAINILRSESARKTRQQVLARAEDYHTSPAVLERLIDDERNRAVNQLLEKLSADEHQIVVLYYWGEMSFVDIGKLLNLPPETIRTRAFRARENLRRHMEGKEDA